MSKVMYPADMNAAFARVFNSRDADQLLALYEPEAVLHTDPHGPPLRGRNAIAAALENLLQLSGTMVSRNNFCVEIDGLALLRADWTLMAEDGTEIAAGSSAEIVRRQADGSWLYVVDHAVGASLARVA